MGQTLSGAWSAALLLLSPDPAYNLAGASQPPHSLSLDTPQVVTTVSLIARPVLIHRIEDLGFVLELGLLPASPP